MEIKNSFRRKVAGSTAHRPIRDELSGMVLADISLFSDLLGMATDVKDKDYHKACWILELVLEQQIEWLLPYLDHFCNSISSLKHDGAIRSLSKICLFAVQHQEESDFLTKGHIQLITEACFDWLINPEGKVAAKAYAMRALYLLGKKQDWIYPELKHILQQDFQHHTAAYKVAAREVLKSIK
ncbi:hypothetical protein [Flavobacterium sp. MK4S-17]|uniref:hypothetical protein n=1 Tax=Flavobacterium sp. MK4S-17 TaxID=2543737 RepID=UPI001F203FF6|nr:hypothetical protein [Flavobacterium sp. MK4S-17]